MKGREKQVEAHYTCLTVSAAVADLTGECAGQVQGREERGGEVHY